MRRRWRRRVALLPLGAGGAALPLSYVNDNYCDCTDGSDQPGTGSAAAAGTGGFSCAARGATSGVATIRRRRRRRLHSATATTRPTERAPTDARS